MKRYRYKGREIGVTAGLGGSPYFTARWKPNGSRSRVISPALPLRDTPEEAQRDLDTWAESKGLAGADVSRETSSD